MKMDEKDLDIFLRYPYGAFYDVSKPDGIVNSDAVIVYADLSGITRSIESLEGYFITKISLPNYNPICLRRQMGDFEKKHLGMFETFTEHFRRK